MCLKKGKQRRLLVMEMLTNGRLNNMPITASKLNCSVRTVERILQELRKDGYVFHYSKTKDRYIFIEQQHHGQNDKGEAENLKE